MEQRRTSKGKNSLTIKYVMRINVVTVRLLLGGLAFSLPPLLSWDAPGAVVVQIGQNFTGSRSGIDSDASPPDTNGAVGPKYFVEFLNGVYSVYDKATGTRVQTETDLAFWAAAGVSISSTLAITDPRIVYDGYSQRWFASMVDFSPNARRSTGNRFLLAVSASADPTRNWSAFAFRADPVTLDFADFPTLGVDQTGVYLSGDMFDRSSNEVGPSFVIIPKAPLLTSTPDISGRTSLGVMNYISRGEVMQPAVTTGTPSTPEFVIAAADVATGTRPLTQLVSAKVVNPGATNVGLSTPIRTTVPIYTDPQDPFQPDGSANLDVGDLRFSAAVRRVGDMVYAVQSVEANTRAAIRWYRINAPNSALLDSGTITDPNLDLFYPSIAANEAGVVVIGCNGSSRGAYVSSYAVAGQTVNGSLAFGGLTLLASGAASYQNTDITGISRWGDYSATTVDPEDSTRFWTIQALAVGPGDWATQITEILTGVQLNVRLAAGNLVLSWPASVSGYQLQFSPTLGPTAAWTQVTATTTVLGDAATVTLPASSNAGFFRLAQVN
jgi:hypothetical protein